MNKISWAGIKTRDWISNYKCIKQWDVITHPCPDFNVDLATRPLEWASMSNYMPCFIEDVIRRDGRVVKVPDLGLQVTCNSATEVRVPALPRVICGVALSSGGLAPAGDSSPPRYGTMGGCWNHGCACEIVWSALCPGTMESECTVAWILTCRYET